MIKNFAKLCTPAKLYFAIAVIACIVALFNGVALLSVFLKLVFAAVWTCVLGWFCKKGWNALSWFLVLLPYIVILLAMFRIMHLSSGQRKFLNTVQLQGAWGKENMTTNTMKATKK
jgi:hypothetical protein